MPRRQFIRRPRAIVQDRVNILPRRLDFITDAIVQSIMLATNLKSNSSRLPPRRRAANLQLIECGETRLPRSNSAFSSNLVSPPQPDSPTVVNDVKRLDIGGRFAEVS